MQNNTFYMQIHENNLADYFNRAIILPTKYISNRTEEDIQSKNEDVILLSDGYFEDLKDNQILLEIVLTNEEIKLLDKIFIRNKESLNSDDGYTSKIPFPITRIINIYFENKDIREHYKSLFKVGDVGYLPNDRLKLLSKNFKKKLQQYSIISNVRNKTIKWSKLSKESKLYPYKLLLVKSKKNREKLLKYDKIMGMFSFMKNTNLYFSDKNKYSSNYSNHYFNLLKLLNTSVEATEIDEKKLSFLKKMLQIEEMTILIKKLYKDEQIDEDFIKENTEKSNNKETLDKLFDEMTKMEALKSLKDAKEFYLAYLYCNRFDGDMESLKAKIVDIGDVNKAEILLAMFGLYYGYSKLRAREEILIQDDFFKVLLIDKRENNIKFMLDSKLDYITIESIYQYVFNNKISDEDFSYLEYPKKYKNLKIQESKQNQQFYTIEKNKYFNIEKIDIVKKEWKDIIKERLNKYPKIITWNTPNLFAYMFEKGISIDAISIKENKFEKVNFKKESIEKIIEEEKNEKEQSKILKLFNSDGK